MEKSPNVVGSFERRRVPISHETITTALFGSFAPKIFRKQLELKDDLTIENYSKRTSLIEILTDRIH